MPIIGTIASSRVNFVNTPPVTSGLTHWYDFSDSTTMTLSSNKVSLISNKSPASGGVNMTQSTGSQQPTYTTGVKNGRAAVLFNNSNGTNLTNSVMPSSGSITNTVISAGINTTYSAANSAVGQAITSWGNYNVAGAGFTAGMNPSNGVSPGSLGAGFAGDWANYYAYSTNSYSGVWAVQAATVSGASLTTIINNTDSGTKTAGASTVTNNGEFFIGQLGNPWYSSGGWNGYLGDLLIYNRVLTTQEKTDMWLWLKAKWGL